MVPGFADMILTSGAPLPWERYVGGQREAILGAAQFEGLAADREDAEAKLAAGEIRVEPCHAHGCVGSVAGVYTASMPVFVVENRPFGNVGFCNSGQIDAGVVRAPMEYFTQAAAVLDAA